MKHTAEETRRRVQAPSNPFNPFRAYPDCTNLQVHNY